MSRLADDLADIYRDLKAGLSLFEANHPIDAAWEWRFGFQTHWGHHLVGAQQHNGMHRPRVRVSLIENLYNFEG